MLCQQKKLRCDPFEWVYEGLDPLLLPAVISKRKGIPLSLAIAAGAVARRLEMYVQLICADDSQIPGTSSGQSPLHSSADTSDYLSALVFGVCACTAHKPMRQDGMQSP